MLVTFPLVCLSLAPAMKRRGHRLLFGYTIAVGASAMLFFFLGGQYLVVQRALGGLFERITLWNGELWIEVMCIFFILDTFKRQSGADRAPAPAPMPVRADVDSPRKPVLH